jgi:hypothetical protein
VAPINGYERGKSPARVLDNIADRVRENPRPFLWSALLFGVVSGAALWPRVGRSLLGAGVRVALGSLVPPVMSQILEKIRHERTT